MSLTACRETEWKGTGITINISLVTVGKVKEKYYRDAIAEYAKRLSRYCKLEIIEVADEKTPDKASETEADQIKQKEAERILKNIRDDAYCIALAIEGKKTDSVSMAKHLEYPSINRHITPDKICVVICSQSSKSSTST
mgnify:CR=1 FL=1